MTPDSAIATAADYADAMITARRAKNILLLVLLLMLLGQIAIFFAIHFSAETRSLVTASTTQPSTGRTDLFNFLTNGFMFLALGSSIVLSFVLLLIVNIMLVGRLIGVARVTSAYVWSIILLFLLFPWQFFLSNTGLTMDRINWKIPGVLWTWSELVRDGAFSSEMSTQNILHWARFAVMPLVGVIIILAIRIKSTRGIRQALGEDDSMRTETGV